MQRSTKAQIQIGEIIVVVFVFIIIFIFGMYAYTQYLGGEREMEYHQTQQLSLVEKMREIINFAEIQCSINAKSDQACVDAYRIQAFQSIIAGGGENSAVFNDYYEERFSGYGLNLHIVYPQGALSGSNYGGGVIFDYKPQNARGRDVAIIPVSVYDPLTGRRYLGALELIQYQGVGA